MFCGRICDLQMRNPRYGSQPVVVGGGVAAQCQRIDHVATAAAIPNAMEQPAKALPDGGVKRGDSPSTKIILESPMRQYLPSSSVLHCSDNLSGTRSMK